MKALFAMDLMGGKSVRLMKGDFTKVTVYSDNPVEKIQEMIQRGARDFHIIDLDGARMGRKVHHKVIEQIRQMVTGYMEVGGGVRELEDINYYRDMGLNGIIVGTRALEDDAFFKALGAFGNIILGLDLFQGKPMVRGWKRAVNRDVEEVLDAAKQTGVMAVLCTSIERDGMLTGPDYAGLKMLAAITDLPLIASGGVTTIDDVKRLKDTGVFATILGKAVYEGLIKIEEAIAYAD
ncbi:MAG TPA: 1-(5-phosphoribosyl)-5-[(5-phosphoribosylamino)methylideneamino] imidazole-4-carboxamide isomerase [Syntrophorhabdaceae bacterium]|nr:1-(5-phosphoribosyl)-5-[(5-phosphoribosylamino)methylideneamino] imidazole-4-carboxamide isomerase [Syntrophorhabdaceae bacterium]